MFTTSQQYAILRYLGWPIRTIDSTSLSYSKILSDRLTQFPDDAITIVQSLLDRLTAIDAQLQTMIARSNVKSVDDIEFFEDGTMELRKERQKVIKEIASLLDFPIGPGARGGSMVCIGQS
jgi:hypothetical protein